MQQRSQAVGNCATLPPKHVELTPSSRRAHTELTTSESYGLSDEVYMDSPTG